MTGTQWGIAAFMVAMGLIVVSSALAAPGGRARRNPGQKMAAQSGLDLHNPHAYDLGPGSWQVTTQDLTLHDAARGKDLQIRVYVPSPAANIKMRSDYQLPLVVFSHGAGGDRRVAPELLSHWASYGYVVIAPTHADSISLQREQGGRPNIDRDIALMGVDPQKRIDRVKDITLVLDQLPEIERQLPALAGRIDTARIGMAGHSAGAMTAMLVGGAQGNQMPNMLDARFKCAIVLSGQGVGKGWVFQEHAWDNFTLPALVVTGSLDKATNMEQGPASRREGYERAPATGSKYLLFIDGATHMSYTGKMAATAQDEQLNRLINGYLAPGAGVQDNALQYDQTAIFQEVQSATLAFLDAYVKDDPAAKAYLQSDNMQQLAKGVEWDKK